MIELTSQQRHLLGLVPTDWERVHWRANTRPGGVLDGLEKLGLVEIEERSLPRGGTALMWRLSRKGA